MLLRSRDTSQLLRPRNVSHPETPSAPSGHSPPRAHLVPEGFSDHDHPWPSQGEPGHPGLNTPCADPLLNEQESGVDHPTDTTMSEARDYFFEAQLTYLLDTSTAIATTATTHTDNNTLKVSTNIWDSSRLAADQCGTAFSAPSLDNALALIMMNEDQGRDGGEEAHTSFFATVDGSSDDLSAFGLNSDLFSSSTPSSVPAILPFSTFVLSPIGIKDEPQALDRKVSVSGVDIDSISPPTQFMSLGPGLGSSSFDNSFPFEMSAFEPTANSAPLASTMTDKDFDLSQIKSFDAGLRPHLTLTDQFRSDPVAMDQSLESPLGLDLESPFSELLASPMFDDAEDGDDSVLAEPSSTSSSSLNLAHAVNYSSLFGLDSIHHTHRGANPVARSFSSESVSPAASIVSRCSNLDMRLASSTGGENLISQTTFDSAPSFALTPSTIHSSSTSSLSSSASVSLSRKPIPNGFRGLDTPLVQLDAPVQARKYVVPSSTSRKRTTAAAERALAKRPALSLSSTAVALSAAAVTSHPAAPSTTQIAIPNKKAAAATSSSAEKKGTLVKSSSSSGEHNDARAQKAAKTEEEEQQGAEGEGLPEHVLAAIERKRRQNTLSARKSRHRKQEQLGDLAETNARLVDEVQVLRGRVEILTGLLLRFDPSANLLA